MIVCLDADPLFDHPAALSHARDFASRRRGEDGTMARLYSAEPMVTLTGAAADHRVAVPPRGVEAVARRLASVVLGTGSVAASTDARATAFADAAARDLLGNRGRSLVVAGPRQAAEVHLLAHLLNIALGNVGSTVTLQREAGPSGADAAARFAEELRGQGVDTLVILGGNPAYTLSSESDLGGAISKVPTTVRLGLFEDETSRLCRYSSSLQVGESDIANALKERNENETAAVGYVYTLYPVTIVFARGSSEANLAAKRSEAENLRSRFVSCNEGLAMARALRDVAVREPITRSSADLTPQLRDLLGNMQIGRLTTPEVTAQGLQMFAVCAKKESTSESPAKRAAREQIFNKRFEAESKKYLEEIRKQAMIEYK